jgi:hypothetical protein
MKPVLTPTLLALALTLAGTAQADNSAAGLQQQVDQLNKQLADMKNELDAIAAAQGSTSPKLAAFEKLSIWGYGEIYYARPTHVSRNTQVDLARGVFGIGYQFDDSTRFNSEYEVEHGVSSASDPGEFEVEQLYVDHKVNDSYSVQTGLFLIPAGLLNESHEPTNFYGVQRNFVEKLIIPSTWREGGIALHGDSKGGLRWSLGLTTGSNLSAWEINPETPSYTTALEMQNEAGPLQATHQELALANGQNLSQFLSLNYLGLPGLDLGGSVFTGLASQSASASKQRVTLWETHGRWTPGKLELSALYAHGSISNTADVNILTPGASNPMPASFYGYYGQAAYTAWQHGESRISPFVRAERYNMADTINGLAPGFGATPSGPVVLDDGSTGSWPKQADTVYTVGANYYLNANVVFKADYQEFHENKDFNRFDLGLGVAF